MGSTRIEQGWNGDPEQLFDCIVIGGGPAGLTAALYLARFLRRCLVIDAGTGRARVIPRSHNVAGFPDGIAGKALLARMQRQLQQFGGTIQRGEVDAITPSAGGFLVSQELEVFRTRALILATGVINHRPVMSDLMHDIGVQRGLIRYCPICDGYEARRGTIAVLGADQHGAAEAEFLAGYGGTVTLLAQRSLELSAATRSDLEQRGVSILASPAEKVSIGDKRVEVRLGSGELRAFDTLYPALGSSPRSSLGVQIGADVSMAGCLLTNEHQQTTVPGLYAIGDVVEGLDQISVAMGQAAVAATAVHNSLRRSVG